MTEEAFKPSWQFTYVWGPHRLMPQVWAIDCKQESIEPLCKPIPLTAEQEKLSLDELVKLFPASADMEKPAPKPASKAPSD